VLTSHRPLLRVPTFDAAAGAPDDTKTTHSQGQTASRVPDGASVPGVPSSTDLLKALCPQLRGVQVERIVTHDGVVEVVARTHADQAVRCPECASPSARVHSRYQRRVADCAMGEQPVRIRLHVRRL